MFYCCKKVGIDWKSAPYYLLGDDVVICHEGLALCYKEFINDLGVEISAPKSFISPNYFEFAKRIFYKNREITPYPISAMKESLRSVTTFVSTILETENKGWFVCSTPSEAIATAHGIFNSYRSKYRAKVEKTAFVTDRILRCVRGSLPTGQAVEACFSKLGFSFEGLTISDSVGNNILENIVVDLFSQQPEMAPITNEGPSSFELASDLVCLLTGLDDERIALGLELIYALPVTMIHGQLEQVYMDLTKKAKTISTTGGN